MKRKVEQPVGHRGICERCGAAFVGSVFAVLCPGCRLIALRELEQQEKADEERRRKEAAKWQFLTPGQ